MEPKILIGALMMALVLVNGAWAADEKIEEPSAVPTAAPSAVPSAGADTFEPYWTGFLTVGPTISPSTSFAVKDSSGSLLGSSSTDDKAAVQIGAEVNHRFSPVFASMIVFEYAKYRYNDGSPSDSEVALLVAPKAQMKSGKFQAWAALGLGLVHTKIGQTSGTASGVMVAVDDSTLGFAVSPRFGFDADVGGDLILGAQFAYMTASGSVGAAVSSGGVTEKLNEDFTRGWLSVGVRVGTRF